PMLSTVTAVLFFSPHSLMYFSLNHLSKAGTKCTHWMILRVFFAAGLWDFGAKIVGPRPAPSAAAVVVLMKSRRVIPLPFIACLSSMSDSRLVRESQSIRCDGGSSFFSHEDAETLKSA